MSGWLLVASGDRMFGLPGDGVREILVVEDVLPAPTAHRAVRGVMPVHGRLVPLVHLGAVLAERVALPATPAAVAVVVTVGGRTVALEVDATYDFVRESPDPVPVGWDVPWAGGVARREEDLVPIVNLDVLVERLRAAGAGVR